MSPAATRSRGTLHSALATLAALTTVAGCATATPPFRTASGAIEPRSVAEQTWLAVDGPRQYLLVRGRDAGAPVVLFVHGGPGASETALMRLFHPALEEQVVMAYWDQHGAGKS